MHDTYPAASLDLPVPYTLPAQDMPVDYYPEDSLETLRRSATAALHVLMDATEREAWDMATPAEVDTASTAWVQAQDAYNHRLVEAHQA